MQGTFGDNLGNSPLKQSILYTSDVELKYWQNDLTFVLAALNFIEPEKNHFRYIMEGYKKEWTSTNASDRRIRYTNLSPGRYKFRVIASNNDGRWNEEGRTIAITIHPPWWLTWWAYTLYFFAAIAALWWYTYSHH